MEKKGIKELYLKLGDSENILVVTLGEVSTGGGRDEWAMRGAEQWDEL